MERFRALFMAFKKANFEFIGNEDLYKVVFEDEYEKDKDYLIRNELRKFSRFATDFLVDCHVKNAAKKQNVQYQYLYLEALRERSLFPLLELEVNRMKSGSERVFWDFELLNQHTEAILRYQIPQAQFKKEDLEKLLQLMLDFENDLICEFGARYERYQSLREGTNWILQKRFGAAIKMPKKNVSFNIAEKDKSKLWKIQEQVKESWLIDDAKRQKLLLKILETVNACDSNIADIQFVKIHSLVNLGMNAYLQKDFLKAENFFSDLVELIADNTAINYAPILYNAISLKLRLQKFDEALAMIKKERKGHKKIPYSILSSLEAIAFIGNGNLAAAEKIAQQEEDSSLDRHAVLYRRFLRVMIAVEQKEYPLAETFAYNLLQNSYYKSETDTFTADLLRIVIKATQAWAHPDATEKKDALNSCREKLLEYIAVDTPQYASDNLLSCWLLNRLNEF